MIMLRAQGLSDFRTPALPAVGDIVDDRCYLYVAQKDPAVPFPGACVAVWPSRLVSRQGVFTVGTCVVRVSVTCMCLEVCVSG